MLSDSKVVAPHHTMRTIAAWSLSRIQTAKQLYIHCTRVMGQQNGAKGEIDVEEGFYICKESLPRDKVKAIEYVRYGLL